MFTKLGFSNNKLLRISQHVVRYSSKTTKASVPKPLEFSDEELKKIIQELNQESSDNLQKLNIPSGHIKKIEMWKSKLGSFKTMNDILEIEGLDSKNLAKICRSIQLDEPISAKKSTLKNRQLVSPVLSKEQIQGLTSFVGLHIGASGVGWAQISCSEKKLTSWGVKSFSNLSSKTSTLENFEMASDVLKLIPEGDIYIFEAAPGIGMSSQNQLALIMSYLHQVEFNSMLFALLNTSTKHNSDYNESTVCNKIYHLKSKIAARLFQTWVGTEKVSSLMTVQQLFRSDTNLPCTPLEIDQNAKNNFENQSSLEKELMGQSLLLSIAFLDLCVLKNPSSLEVINTNRKNK